MCSELTLIFQRKPVYFRDLFALLKIRLYSGLLFHRRKYDQFIKKNMTVKGVRSEKHSIPFDLVVGSK